MWPSSTGWRSRRQRLLLRRLGTTLKAIAPRNFDENYQQGEWHPAGPISFGGRICCRPLPWGMS